MNYVKGMCVPLIATLLAGCNDSAESLDTVDYVDLDRFMCDWYVIANIPTFLEKDAYNPVETYSLNKDGTIATTFVFRKGGFDGPRKEYHPKGFVRDRDSNAVWGMQFVWPIKGDYRIVYLAEDYSVTIIGRNKRDFVWLMARTPEIDEALFLELRDRIAAMGYDVSKFQKAPQSW
jgi:apolipoprotein D and lipocalin family protein